MFVYSVSEASSLHYLSQWIKDTQNFAPNATRMLVGNKVDIEPMEIDELTSKSFAKAHEFDLHFHISCKSNSGIIEAFEQLAASLHKPGGSPTRAAGGQRRASPQTITISEQEAPGEENQPSSSGGGCAC